MIGQTREVYIWRLLSAQMLEEHVLSKRSGTPSGCDSQCALAGKGQVPQDCSDTGGAHLAPAGSADGGGEHPDKVKPEVPPEARGTA